MFCLFVVNFTTLFSMILVGGKTPFKIKFDNHLEMFNEFYILCLNYHLLCFTDFVLDPLMRVYIGWSLVGFTSFFMSYNFAIASMAIFRESINKLKKCNEKRK